MEIVHDGAQVESIDSFLEGAPFEESCGDGVMVGVVPNIEHIDPICTGSLNLATISSSLLPTTPSHLHAFHESLGDSIIPPWTLIMHT